MTHISCPLCAKLSHVNSFHPENLGNDIEYVEMRSLGGRRGFQVTGRYSALGDTELMGRISTRLHELQRLINGKEVSLDEENQRLLDSVEELDDEKGELLSLINEVLSTVYTRHSRTWVARAQSNHAPSTD